MQIQTIKKKPHYFSSVRKKKVNKERNRVVSIKFSNLYSFDPMILLLGIYPIHKFTYIQNAVYS